MSSSPNYQSSPKCHHRLNVIIAPVSSSPNVIAQIASSPKWASPILSSPKCHHRHHRPNVIIAQMASSLKCHHRPNAIIPIILKCHHRPNAIIAQCHHRPKPSVFIFALSSFNVFDCYTTHPPPYYFSFYTLISLLDVSWCVKLDGSCNQQQKCWIILSKLRSSGHMQLFKISCITCLSALKETDHWLERQKKKKDLIWLFSQLYLIIFQC